MRKLNYHQCNTSSLFPSVIVKVLTEREPQQKTLFRTLRLNTTPVMMVCKVY